MAKKALTDIELKAIVDSEIESAMGYLAGELSDQRSTAMDRYLGEPLGTELPGRSQVQTRDVLDVIEWIMPSLIRIFSDQDHVVTIEPVGPEDEQQAEQETDYLNYLFYKKNPGFLILYTWFKDALLQKNGITKLRVEQDEDKTRETYAGLTNEQFMFLNSDPDLDMIEYEYVQTDDGDSISATFIRTDSEVEICVDNVAPEDHLISTDARCVDPKKARFNAHIRIIPVSELREMGFEDREIDMMENGPELDVTTEKITRNNLTDEQRTETPPANEAMQTKKLYECYLRADKNGDGIAEVLKIFRSGDFIETEEVDKVPFNAITPVILTHKFHGFSIADLITDLQELRTGLLRSYMDNIYQTINGTTYYDENKVNVEDMLTSTPYGIRGVNGAPGDSILHIPPSGLPAQSYELFQLAEDLIKQRVGDFQAQIDPSQLADVNNGVVMRMFMEVRAKTEMVARIFAETGVKELFRDLHEAARKHSDRETIIKLRNNWVPVNPSAWRERTDFTVKVGLGNATKEERMANMNALLNLQERAAQAGGMGVFMTAQNLYESAIDMTEALGYPNPQKYWTHPSQIPPPPQQPDAQMAAVQATMQIESQKTQQREQQSQRESQLKLMELRQKQQDQGAKERLEVMNLEIKRLKEQAAIADSNTRMQLEARYKQMEEQMGQIKMLQEGMAEQSRQAIDVYKAELEAGTKLVLDNNQAMQTATQELKTRQKDPQAAKLLAAMLDSIEGFNDRFAQLEETIKRPPRKVIERDAQGKAIAINGIPVERDANGRLIGI